MAFFRRKGDYRFFKFGQAHGFSINPVCLLCKQQSGPPLHFK
jgi:hypothetical protein